MLTRRQMMSGVAALAAAPALPSLTVAAAPTDSRLVLLILRGGMDGLDAVQPFADPAFAALRPNLARSAATGLADLDGFFGLHPGGADMLPLFRARELGFVHAVASPYRRRSHFEAQDFIESGLGTESGTFDGWLNRLVGRLGGREDLAVDIGGNIVLTRGKEKVVTWAPNTDLTLSASSEFFLRQLYAEDTLLLGALDGAIGAEQHDDDSKGEGSVVSQVMRTAARMLKESARIAAITIPGWDTHLAQGNVRAHPERIGIVGNLLRQLGAGLNVLKTELGPSWERTCVVGLSEFGRSARQNGTNGTDHGTGGLLLLSGGAIRNGAGGKVTTTRWPGLGPDQLHEGRDLLPTDDIRRYVGWLISDHFHVTPANVAREIFPGVDLGQRLKLV